MIYCILLVMIQETIQNAEIQNIYINYCGWQKFLTIDMNKNTRIKILECNNYVHTKILYEVMEKILKMQNLFIDTLIFTSTYSNEIIKKLINTSNVCHHNKNIYAIHKSSTNKINLMICRDENENEPWKVTLSKKHISWEYIFTADINDCKNIQAEHVNFAHCRIPDVITQVIGKLKLLPNIKSIDFFESGITEDHIQIMKKNLIYSKLISIDTTKCNINTLYKTIIIDDTKIHKGDMNNNNQSLQQKIETYIDGLTTNLIINKIYNKHSIFNAIITIHNLYLNMKSLDNLQILQYELSKVPYIMNIYINDTKFLPFAQNIKRPYTNIHTNNNSSNII